MPSLVSGVGGISELVEHNTGGLVFAPGAKSESYARAVVALLDDQQAYERLALGARSAFMARLNWAASAQRVMQLLKEVSE